MYGSNMGAAGAEVSKLPTSTWAEHLRQQNSKHLKTQFAEQLGQIEEIELLTIGRIWTSPA